MKKSLCIDCGKPSEKLQCLNCEMQEIERDYIEALEEDKRINKIRAAKKQCPNCGRMNCNSIDCTDEGLLPEYLRP